METIGEHVAWIHSEATTLETDDLVKLKHCLKNLIADAVGALNKERDHDSNRSN